MGDCALFLPVLVLHSLQVAKYYHVWSYGQTILYEDRRPGVEQLWIQDVVYRKTYDVCAVATDKAPSPLKEKKTLHSDRLSGN